MILESVKVSTVEFFPTKWSRRRSLLSLHLLERGTPIPSAFVGVMSPCLAFGVQLLSTVGLVACMTGGTYHLEGSLTSSFHT